MLWRTLPDSDAKVASRMEQYRDELGQVRASVAAEMGRKNVPRKRLVAEQHHFFG